MSDDSSLPIPQVPGKTLRGATGRSLARDIFAADVPEEQIRQIPAQALYIAVRENGLESSGDLVTIATPAQLAVLLDLDLWQGDQFEEENLWTWLSLPDAEDDLAPLQKVLRSIDLKLLALLFERYVEVQSMEEPSEQPPSPGFYTPDRGFTWILIKMEDSNKHFYLGRLLAMLFETDTNIFYQLLALPNVSTRALIEEEAFQDRERRLSGEDIPDRETAWALHTPLSKEQFVALWTLQEPEPKAIDVQAIAPLVYATGIPQPLGGVFASLAREELEGELSVIINAAIIRYGVAYYEIAEVHALGERVKGLLNIGLQLAMQLTGADGEDIAKRLSLRPLYRLGLWRLSGYRAAAMKVPAPEVEAAVHDATAFSALAGAREDFPVMPSFFKGSIGSTEKELAQEDGRLAPGYQPFETIAELEQLEQFLSEKFSFSSGV